MARIAYYRVSTNDQSIDAQRHAMGGSFDKEFSDEGVSGAVKADKRAGFSALLEYAREGDTVYVYAVDRLGRDALDIQSTVRSMIDRGISVHVHGLGVIAQGVGELILAVLAQVASIERHRITERTSIGRELAREMFEKTGRTHRGKTHLGRPHAADPKIVSEWRRTNQASISKTAEHFGLGKATVTRYCSSHGKGATA